MKNPLTDASASIPEAIPLSTPGSDDEKWKGIKRYQVLSTERKNSEVDGISLRPPGAMRRFSSRADSLLPGTRLYSAEWAENRIGLLGRVRLCCIYNKPAGCPKCCTCTCLPCFAHHAIDEDEPPRGIWQIYWSRLSVLIVLLFAQSLSSIILREYDDLLDSIVEITIYLTMLIGAGGNSGNQVCIDVIRSLATQELEPTCSRKPAGKEAVDTINTLFRRETLIGFMTSVSICAFGWIRVYLFEDIEIANAITFSLFLVTFTAVIVGGFLPLFFFKLGVDPAHAGPTVQVFMDIIGVTIVCNVCKIMLANRIEQ